MKSANRVLTALIVCILIGIIPMLAGAASVSNFTDFPTGTWSEEAMTAAVNNGLLQGKGDGMIAPHDYLTRAEAATIINRAFGATVKADITKYTDVTPQDWYYSEFQKAVNMRTIVGVSDTEINPAGYITREAVFTVIARALVLSTQDTSVLAKFGDGSSVSPWASSHVAAMVQNGYVNGDNLGKINPQAYITREEFAQIMHNIVKTYISQAGEVTGTYNNLLVRAPGASLNNLTVNGDLIIADGVGAYDVTFTNVKVTGRILFRGAGNVTFDKLSTVGKHIVVNDVNKTVHFQNFQNEPIFTGIVLNTHATFIQSGTIVGGGGGGGGGGSRPIPGVPTAKYKVTVKRQHETNDYDQDEKTYDEEYLPDVTANKDAVIDYVYELKDDEKDTFRAPIITYNKEDRINDGTLQVTVTLNRIAREVEDSSGVLHQLLAGQNTVTNTETDDIIEILNEYEGNLNSKGYTVEFKDLYSGEPLDMTDPETLMDIISGEIAVKIERAEAITYYITYIVKNHPVAAENAEYFENENGSYKGPDGSIFNTVTYSYTVETPTFDLPWLDDYTDSADSTEYFFDGWYDSDEVDGDQLIGNDIIEGNIIDSIEQGTVGNKTFYAQYLPAAQYTKYVIETKTQKITDDANSTAKTYDRAVKRQLAKEGSLVNYRAKAKQGFKTPVVTYDPANKVNGGDLVITVTYDRIMYSVTTPNGEQKFYYGQNPVTNSSRIELIDILNEYKYAPENNGYTVYYKNKATGDSLILTNAATKTKLANGEIDVLVVRTPKNYSINYKLMDGEGRALFNPLDSQKRYTVEQDVVLPIPTWTGYTFLGWYEEETFVTPVSQIAKGTTGVKTFYAKWVVVPPQPVTYTVTFGGKTYTANQGAKLGSAVDTLGNTLAQAFEAAKAEIPNGYEFDKFHIANNTAVTVDTIVSSDMAVDINKNVINYTITFNTNGKGIVNSITYNVENYMNVVLPTAEYDGYEFLTWLKESGEDIDHIAPGTFGNLVFTADWEIVEYTLEFNFKGGIKAQLPSDYTYTVESGEYVLPTEFAGYTFGGWYDADGMKYTRITTGMFGIESLTAELKPINYTVVFDTNGKATVGEITYNIESDTTVFVVPTANGYTFDGWYLDAGFTGEAVTAIPAGSTGNAKYYAKWQIIDYKIVFDTNGKGIVADVTYNVESNTYVLPAPTYNGYTFGGWYVDADFSGEAVTEVPAGSFGDIKYYASWQIINYTIKFKTNGAAAVGDIIYNVENDTITLPVITKENYIFLGWYTDAEFTGTPVTVVPAGSFGDKTYYAKWEEIPPVPVMHTITFNGVEYTVERGTAIGLAKDANGNKLSDAMAAASADRNGYTFDGFRRDGDDVTVITKDTIATLDMSIDTKWVIVTYKVVFETNGKGTITDVTYDIESDTYVLPKPTYNGYTFGGWYYSEDFAGVSVTEIPAGSIGDKKLFAKWTVINYVAVFETNGKGFVESVIYNVENNTITLPAPTFNGYTFGGWYVNADFSGAPVTVIPAGSYGDIKYYASWQIINYTIKFKTNGAAAVTDIIYNVENDTITLPVITKENYLFLGWYADAEFTGTPVTVVPAGSFGDKTYYAKWEEIPPVPVIHTITFNGVQYTVERATAIGEAVDANGNKLSDAMNAAVVEKAGYTFDGFRKDGDNDTVITKDTIAVEDMTISPVWEAITYSITFDTNGIGVQDPVFYTVEYDEFTLPVPADTADYKFDGWYASADFSGVPVTVIAAGTIGDKTFYAKWISKDIPVNAILGFDHKVEGNKVEVYVTLDKLPYDVEDLASITLEYVQDSAKGLKYIDTKSAVGGTVQAVDGKIAWFADNALTQIPEDGKLFTITYEKTEESYGDVVFAYAYTELTDSKDTVAKGYEKTSETVNLGEIVPVDSVLGFDYTADDSMVEVYVTLDKIPYDVKDLASITLEYAQNPAVLKYVSARSEIGGNLQSADGKLAWFADSALTQIPEDGILFTIVYEKTAESYGDVELSYTYAELTDSADTAAKAYGKTAAVINLGGVVPVDSVLGFDYTADDSMVEVYVTLDKIPYDIKDLASITLNYAQNPESGLKYIRTESAIGEALQAKDGAIAWFAQNNAVTEIPDNGILFTIVYEKTSESYGDVEFSYTYTEITDSTDTVAKAYETSAQTVIIGAYVPKTFTIEFDGVYYKATEGQTIAKAVDSAGNTLGEAMNKAAIVADGYIFEGFFETGDASYLPITADTIATRDMSVYAKISKLSYTITFVTNGAAAVDSITYDVESSEITLPVITKENYIFLGWYADAEFTGTPVTVVPAGSFGDKTYHAKWEEVPPAPVMHTIILGGVSYTAERGTAIGLAKDANGNKLSDAMRAENVEKAGYTFDGFRREGDDVTVITEGTIATSDMTIKAKWTVVTYKAAFNTDGKVSIEDITYTIEDDAITLPVLSAYGYKFDGWYENTDFTGEAKTVIPAGSYGDRIYYAKWTVINYVAVFETNGKGFVESVIYNVENDTITLPAPTFNGYTFGGWYVNADFSGAPVTVIPAGSYGDIKYYASWQIINYTITFDTNGAEAVDEITYNVENDTITLPAISMDGYIFLGWYVDEAFTGKPVAVVPAGSFGDKTYYAKWEEVPPAPVMHTITFDGVKYRVERGMVIGEAVDANGNKLSDAMLAAEKEEKPGYAFDYFRADGDDTVISADTIAVADMKLTAKWRLITYLINLYKNGLGQVIQIEYTVESDDIIFPVLEDTDTHTFEGWFDAYGEEQYTMLPAGSTGHKFYYAKWTEIPVVTNSVLGFDYTADDSMVEVYVTLDKLPYDIKDLASITLEYAQNPAVLKYVSARSEIGGNIQSADGKLAWFADSALTQIPEDGILFTIVYEKTAESYGDVELSYTYAEITDSADAVAKAYDKTPAVIKLGDVVPVDSVLGFDYTADDSMVEVYVTLDKIPYDVKDLASITLEYAQNPAVLKYVSARSEIGGNIQSADGKLAWFADSAVTQIPEDGILFTIVYEKTAESYGDVELSYTYAEITDSADTVANAYDKTTVTVELGEITEKSGELGFGYSVGADTVTVTVEFYGLPTDLKKITSASLEYDELRNSGLKYIETKSNIGGTLEASDGKIAWFSNEAVELKEHHVLFSIIYDRTEVTQYTSEFVYTSTELVNENNEVAKDYETTGTLVQHGFYNPENSILGFDYWADGNYVDVYVTLDKIPEDIDNLASITLEYNQTPVSGLKYIGTESMMTGEIVAVDGKIAWYSEAGINRLPKGNRLFAIKYEKTADTVDSTTFAYSFAEIADSSDNATNRLVTESKTVALDAYIPEAFVVTFLGKTYKAYEGDMLGDAMADDGILLKNAMEEAKTKEGYTFDIFHADGDETVVIDAETIVTGNITVVAKYTIVNYNVEFNTEVEIDIENITYNIESGEIVFVKPEANGYEFGGWYLNEDFTGEPVTKLPAGSFGDVKVYANWTIINYDVVFNSKVDVNIENITYNIKSDKIVFVNPVANGYTFGGWYLNADFTGEAVTEIPAGSFGDVTVYANWTLINYNVVYNSKVDIDIENITYNIESDKIVFVNPVVNGYIFGGWYLNADFTGEAVTEIPAGSFGDLDIYASWTLVNYNITFDTDIDVDIDDIVYNIESDTVVLPRPVYPGYMFLGWYLDAELTIPVSEVPTGSFGDKTYYAKWELLPAEPEIYTIIFAGTEYTVTQGDILGNAVDANGKTLADAMAEAKKDGYNLDGFHMEGDVDFVINTNIIATQDMTVVAKFTVINYNVVFNTKVDIDIDNIVYNIESDTIKFVTPSADGYIFNGWYLNEDFTGDAVTEIPAGSIGDVNVFASWTVINYNVVFETYGKIDIDNIVYNIESDTITFVSPVVNGYTFNGWYLNADFTGEAVTNIPQGSFGDVNVFASWTLINYSATFKTDIDVDIDEIVFNIESDTIILPTPSYEGYVFLGWYLDAEFNTQISEIVKGTYGDQIFYAKWKAEDPKPLIYTITFGGVAYTVEEGNKLADAVDANGNTLADAMAAVEAKDGYALDSFHEEGNEEAVINLNIIAAKDMTVVVKFTLINYNIVFETYGKVDIDNIVFNIESDTIQLPTPSYEGYIFIGWFDNEALTGDAVKEIAKGTFGNKTFYAKWEEIIDEPDTYLVTFEGTVYTATEGEAIGKAVDANGNTLAEAMTAASADKDGYIFSAFVNAENDSPVTKDTIAESDMTINAKWELVTYTITFVTNSGETIEAVSYTIETETFGLPAPQDTESMIFIGWFDNEALTGDAVKEIANGTFGNKTFYAKWEEILPEYFTVKLYKGTNETPEGYYEVAENEYITQEMIDSVLGAPETYKATKGYTDSDGNVHNIYPELWYQVNGEWERFIPENVAIVEDTDVYLLTKYISFGYSTDISIKGVQIPEIIINVPYDSETDIGKSLLDGLTEVRNTINKTLNGLEQKGVDPYQIIIDKLVDLKLADEEGNILNLELDVPLNRFISEELIISTIDTYIDNNIDNEEFIADILRNDTVVDMLIDDDSIKIKVMQDSDMRDKLLTDSVIKEMISNDEVVSWIIEDEAFKTEFINNDATFDYILDDLSELLANEEYHDMIIDACVEFVIDVYFEEEKESPELINYIDSVLDSDEFIAEIEANPELRVLFKEEIKLRIKNLGANPDIKAEIYEEIRTSDEFKKHIIDAVINDEAIMASLRDDIREDLNKADSSYKNTVIAAVRSEFSDAASTLRQSITDKIRAEMADEASELRASVIAAVKADLNDSSSTLKESVTEAIKNDFKDENSTLKASVIAEIKAEMADEASELRASVIEEVIADFANADSELRKAIIDEIKSEMADEASELRASVIAEIKAEMADEASELREAVIEEVIADFESADSTLKASVIEAVRNDFASPDSSLKAAVTETIKAELKTEGSSLRTTILDSAKSGTGEIAEEVKAYAKDNFKEEIKTNAKTTIKDSAKTWVLDNVDSVKDDLKSGVKADEDALTEAILSSGYEGVSDADAARQIAEEYLSKENLELNSKLDGELDDYFANAENNDKIAAIVDTHFDDIYEKVYEDIFDSLYDDPAIFDEAYVSYVNSGDNLEEAFDNYIADEDNLANAIDIFVGDDDNLTDAIEEYAKSRDNLYKAIDIYVSDDDNLNKAIDMYIEDAQNIEKAVDEYIKDDANIEKAVDTFIKKDANIEKAIDTYVKDDANIEKAIDTYVKNDANVEKAIDMYIDDEDNFAKAVDMYIADDANLLSAINNYIADDDKLKEIFDIYAKDTENLIEVFDEYIKVDANLDSAFETFVSDETRFDNFYEDYLGENASDPELFNTLFEKYYHAHVHDVAKEAYDNASLHALVMDYVHDYTEELVMEYADGTLAVNHPELVATIDNLMENEFPAAMREQYFAPGSTIKATVDELIETEGRKLITKYVEGTLDADTEAFISDTIHDNIGIIVDDYVAGTLDEDIKTLIDNEINDYMRKLIDDYISGADRETLSDLIPTYAKDAVDALKNTDAFKNTISDFVSGNGVRVNNGNIMFVSILAELLGGYDYAKIKAEFLPANIVKYADIVGDDVIGKYVDTLFTDFVSGMNAAVDAVKADTDNGIEDAEYTFSTRPTVVVEYMKDFVVNYYNKLMNKAKAKLYEKTGTKLDNNPYAKQLVETNWIELYLDRSEADALKSGYKLKAELVDYYDVTLKQAILLHDAVTWYGNNTEMALEDKLEIASALINTYANKANDVIMNYIENGELPKGYTKDMIISKVESIFESLSGKISALDKVESIYDRFEDRINKAVDKAVEIYVEYANRNYDGFVDLANATVYADGKAYPIYQIVLEMGEDAFNIDDFITAVFESDNYHGISKLESAMAKIKSKLLQAEYTPSEEDMDTPRYVEDAYKATVGPREVAGKNIGSHTGEIQRYFRK